MQEAWIEHLSSLLKSFESEKNGQAIHELRRSFEAGKKKARLIPQIEAIYSLAKDRDDFKPEGDPQSFQRWFNEQRFKLVLGLKSVTLGSSGDPAKLKGGLYKLFSKWDPSLYQTSVMEASPEVRISQRKLRMALRGINSLDDEQLANLVARLPQNEESLEGLEEFLPGEKGRAIVERMKSLRKK